MLICAFAGACMPRAKAPKPSENPAFAALHCPNLPKAGDRNAPVAVLYERNPWLMAVGSDFPTAAIWRDGLVVFLHYDADGEAEARQMTVPPAQAARISDEVISATRGVPAFTSVSAWSDQQTVEIVVHDGDAWRIAAIYGLTRDGAPAAIDWVNSVGLNEEPILTRHEGARPTVPGRFMNAYREMLALDRSNGVPFEPSDLQILFWGFDHARGDPVPWPADVPPPPADIVPAEREPGDPIAYSYVVASNYAVSLRRAQETAHATRLPRAIGFNGHKWTVSLVSRFRGQDAIDRVLHCNRKHDDGVRVEK